METEPNPTNSNHSLTNQKAKQNGDSLFATPETHQIWESTP